MRKRDLKRNIKQSMHLLKLKNKKNLRLKNQNQNLKSLKSFRIMKKLKVTS